MRVSYAKTPFFELNLTNMTTFLSHGINDLNFSFDGEYLAVANEGSYIDIVGHPPPLRYYPRY